MLHQQSGTTYYVSRVGANTNDGLSPNAPLRKVQYALDLAQAGDTTQLRPGDYFEDLVSRRDVQPDAAITIHGAD